MKIESKNALENKIIDSVAYTKKHSNLNSMNNEVDLLTNKITKIGFMDLKKNSDQKLNDSTYIYTLDFGEQIKFIDLYINKESILKTMMKRFYAGH